MERARAGSRPVVGRTAGVEIVWFDGEFDPAIQRGRVDQWQLMTRGLCSNSAGQHRHAG